MHFFEKTPESFNVTEIKNSHINIIYPIINPTNQIQITQYDELCHSMVFNQTYTANKITFDSLNSSLNKFIDNNLEQIIANTINNPCAQPQPVEQIITEPISDEQILFMAQSNQVYQEIFNQIWDHNLLNPSFKYNIYEYQIQYQSFTTKQTTMLNITIPTWIKSIFNSPFGTLKEY